MNSISISKNKFDNLKKLDTCGIVNTEGELYEFYYRRQRKVLKKLYFQDGTIFANKLYTLEMLNSNKLPSNFIKPDYLVSVSNKIVGFTVPYVEGIILANYLTREDIDIKLQIESLKKVGLIIKDMVNIRKYTNLKEFYLNDIHEANFIVTANDICVIDLDSSKVSPNFNFQARYLSSRGLLKEFKEKYNVTDYSNGAYVSSSLNSDLYCYIIMILNYLYGSNVNNMELSDFYNYINYLKFVGFDEGLLSCFKRIASYKENKNPLDYLDSINRNQLYRAKENVYRKVISR
ncbi:MAG: hypothetical protein J6D28_06020 [Bacilli bacterium]|nr:hypothetical protein [Bacilli bacterium]